MRSNSASSCLLTLLLAAPAVGWGQPSSARKAPRVLSRSASGSAITVTFERAIAADELPPSKVSVLVVRPSGESFAKRNLASGAELSPDRTSLTIKLTEPIRAGQVYFVRGTRNPCPGGGGPLDSPRCTARPLDLGEIVVRSRKPSSAGAIPMSFAVSTRSTTIALEEQPVAPQGSFRVKSLTPGEVENADRKLGTILVTFEGGTIDCVRTGRGKSAFHMYSVSPDVFEQQSMYEDPERPTPNLPRYRGRVLCDEGQNRLVFSTPGVLLGSAYFQIDLHVWSKQGDPLTAALLFKTRNPGLAVWATRVENHYGGDDTCDSYWKGADYCDIYVTTATATSVASNAARIPAEGSDIGNMRYFPADAKNGARVVAPRVVLYANENPVGELLDVQLWAGDKDESTRWKEVFRVAGDIAAKSSAGIAALDPQVGAISNIAGVVFQGVSTLIPMGKDEFLGAGRVLLTSDGRWATQAGPFSVDLAKSGVGRGPVRVFLAAEELPRSWKLRPIIE